MMSAEQVQQLTEKLQCSIRILRIIARTTKTKTGQPTASDRARIEKVADDLAGIDLILQIFMETRPQA